MSPANIWKLSGLELKYILIQQEYIFIEKDHTNIPERKGQSKSAYQRTENTMAKRKSTKGKRTFCKT
jgi:hypothetical protein